MTRLRDNSTNNAEIDSFQQSNNYLHKYEMQLGSTNSAGDDFATVKIVQSIGKILMMNGDEMYAGGDFMPNAVGI